MRKIWLIRHAKTQGNMERRYVGRTDEHILEEEVEHLKKLIMNHQDLRNFYGQVYVSPLSRCVETAAILFPDHKAVPINDFRECDFGDYEYCNYEELKDLKPYQDFIDSMGETAFPNGETKDGFSRRCLKAFRNIIEMEKDSDGDLALVVHGGTIMAIMEQCVEPHRNYYDWQVGNKEGYVLEFDGTLPCTLCGIFDGSTIG